MGDRASTEKQPVDQLENIRQRRKRSDLLKIEKSLRVQTERVQELFDNAPFGIVIIGRDGKFEQVNHRFTELFGYEHSEVLHGRECVHHGVLDFGVQFLQKPFTMDALAKKVRAVLDEP